MEGLVREMQDPESGVPVRSQKLFLTSIPAAFMGYDLIEWLMERLNIEDSAEAVHLANLLCQSGYFFPVTDNKTLTVKDDSSLYRFQTPYYWPSSAAHGHSPDNLEYAIYLAKRSLRNKQRHGLEDHELETLNNLKKTLQNKWDFVTMQAEEQVRLAKDRKKGDKIVTDSQERAYWRVYRPPPGCLQLEILPLPLAACRLERQQKNAVRGKTLGDWKKEVTFLRSCLDRTRVKTSVALDSLVQHANTFLEYDPVLVPVQPSNPWHSDDPTYWQINSPLNDNSLTQFRFIGIGLQEFTNYLRKEYSHENIRFWMAVNDLRRSSQSQIQAKVRDIYDEFLAAGAPCEINIDGKTMEKTQGELRTPSRFAFDSAAEHVYTLLLKKDCYPRFVRSEHYKALLAAGVQPSHKKRFFNFGGPTKKKTSGGGSNGGGANNVQGTTPSQGGVAVPGRGSSHDLARGPATAAAAATAATAASAPTGSDVLTPPTRPHALPASLSHSNVAAEMRCETPYRELRSSSKDAEDVNVSCPWETKSTPGGLGEAPLARDDVCPWDDGPSVSSTSLACASSQETPATAAVTPSVPEIRVHAASSVDEDPTPGTSSAADDVTQQERDGTTEGAQVSEPEPAPSAEPGTSKQSNVEQQQQSKVVEKSSKEKSNTVERSTVKQSSMEERKDKRTSSMEERKEKRASSVEERKDKRTSGSAPTAGEKDKDKEVCPWEDE
ncbi:hypothetical protein B566_EDAN009929 [Ephemera danica]|nr:hypothetical protein B566_EDAN009929 [Ephemera danica]